MKSDDSTLPDASLRRVQKYADLLLRKASAYGRFPTPVDDLVAAAKLEIARESALAKIGMDGFYRQLPNALKLTPEKLKRAAAKVIGLLDRQDRTIHLDPDTHPKKRIYVSLHEVGHDFLPHQRKTFSILEDSETELDPDTKDLYEREANVFASEVLFQGDAFAIQAADFDLAIRVPINLAKKFGPSVYSAARRYVTTHKQSCALLVFNRPLHVVGVGEVMELRRAIPSPSFHEEFGQHDWPQQCGPQDFFMRIRPKNRFTSPRIFRITDLNRQSRECIVEAFDSTHHILFLIYPSNGQRVADAG
jgi:Zn-dependent peptidase ImmA (M78 family)